MTFAKSLERALKKEFPGTKVFSSLAGGRPAAGIPRGLRQKAQDSSTIGRRASDTGTAR